MQGPETGEAGNTGRLRIQASFLMLLAQCCFDLERVEAFPEPNKYLHQTVCPLFTFREWAMLPPESSLPVWTLGQLEA